MTDPQATEHPKGEAVRGIRCPRCGCGHFETIKVVHRPKHVQRRRECRNCGHRITTREQILAG